MGSFSYGSAASASSSSTMAPTSASSHQLNPYDRSMYPYNTPGAFVPHSAINLSVKANEAAAAAAAAAAQSASGIASSSLDLTMSGSFG